MCVPKCLYNTGEHKGQHEFFQKVFCCSMINGDVEEGWTNFFDPFKRDVSNCKDSQYVKESLHAGIAFEGTFCKNSHCYISMSSPCCVLKDMNAILVGFHWSGSLVFRLPVLTL